MAGWSSLKKFEDMQSVDSMGTGLEYVSEEVMGKVEAAVCKTSGDTLLQLFSF